MSSKIANTARLCTYTSELKTVPPFAVGRQPLLWCTAELSARPFCLELEVSTKSNPLDWVLPGGDVGDDDADDVVDDDEWTLSAVSIASVSDTGPWLVVIRSDDDFSVLFSPACCSADSVSSWKTIILFLKNRGHKSAIWLLSGQTYGNNDIHTLVDAFPLPWFLVRSMIASTLLRLSCLSSSSFFNLISISCLSLWEKFG